MIGDEYVAQLDFVEINELFRRHSWSQTKFGKGIRDTFSKATKSAISGVTRVELVHMPEKIKVRLLGTLQLDTLQLKKKHEDENFSFNFYP